MKRNASLISSSSPAVGSTSKGDSLESLMASIPLARPHVYPGGLVLAKTIEVTPEGHQMDTFTISRVVSMDKTHVKVIHGFYNETTPNHVPEAFPWDDIFLCFPETINTTRGASVLALWRGSTRERYRYRRAWVYPVMVYSTRDQTTDDAYRVLFLHDRVVHKAPRVSLIDRLGVNVPATAPVGGQAFDTVISEKPAKQYLLQSVAYYAAIEELRRERKRQEKEARIQAAVAAGAGSALVESLNTGVAGFARAALKKDAKGEEEEPKADEPAPRPAPARRGRGRLAETTPFDEPPARPPGSASAAARTATLDAGHPLANAHAVSANAHAFRHAPRDPKLIYVSTSSTTEALSSLPHPAAVTIEAILPAARAAARGPGLPQQGGADKGWREWVEQLPLRPSRYAVPGTALSAEGIAKAPPQPPNSVTNRVSADLQVDTHQSPASSRVGPHSQGYQQHAAYHMRLHPQMRAKTTEMLTYLTAQANAAKPENAEPYAWSGAGHSETGNALIDNYIPIPFQHPLVPLPSLSTLASLRPARQETEANTIGEETNQPGVPVVSLCPENKTTIAGNVKIVDTVSASALAIPSTLRTQANASAQEACDLTEPKTLKSGVVAGAYVSLF